QLDAVRGLLVILVAEVAGRFPALVPALLDGSGIEALVQHYFGLVVSGSASACATEAATASRTIWVTLTVSSARTLSRASPITLLSVRPRRSSMRRSTSGPSRESTARSSSRASASSICASTAGRVRRVSATISVSTGTRGSSAIVASEVVAHDGVATALIEAKALARRLAVGFLGADHLEQALEAGEVRRAAGGEIQQDRDVGRLVVCRDQHGRLGRELVVRRAMRHETRRLPGPHQPVEALGEL